MLIAGRMVPNVQLGVRQAGALHRPRPELQLRQEHLCRLLLRGLVTALALILVNAVPEFVIVTIGVAIAEILLVQRRLIARVLRRQHQLEPQLRLVLQHPYRQRQLVLVPQHPYRPHQLLLALQLRLVLRLRYLLVN